jgi:glycerol-3-phosphate dehydrogenase (NAD(P)+)
VERLATEHNVDMPISRAIAAVLDGRVSANEALELLMARDPKEEAV